MIALAYTKPPAGCDRWSLREKERRVLLTDGLPPLDDSTIGRVLRKVSVNNLMCRGANDLVCVGVRRVITALSLEWGSPFGLSTAKKTSPKGRLFS